MTPDIPARLRAWRALPHISARSVLATIGADAIAPVTDRVWLSQLFGLGEPFGFNSRLVRTSLFRLVQEGLIENERKGRRSRYRLAPGKEREYAEVSARLYRNNVPPLDAEWTLVLFDSSRVPPRDRDRLASHLGLVVLERGVLASPIRSTRAVRRILDEAFPDILAAVVRAEFSDITELASKGFFSAAFAFESTEQAFGEFVESYSELRGTCEEFSPVDAFRARTMLVHDLRRVALPMPTLPRELLPSPWTGDDAYDLATELYAPLCARSASLLADILEVDYPEAFPDRFPARKPLVAQDAGALING